MDAAATTAFNNVTSGFFTLGATQTFFIGITGLSFILYVVWLCLSAYAEFGNGHLTAFDVVMYAARGIFVLLVVLALLN